MYFRKKALVGRKTTGKEDIGIKKVIGKKIMIRTENSILKIITEIP